MFQHREALRLIFDLRLWGALYDWWQEEGGGKWHEPPDLTLIPVLPCEPDLRPETMAEARVWVRRSETGCGGQHSDSYGHNLPWDGNSNTQVFSQATLEEYSKPLSAFRQNIKSSSCVGFEWDITLFRPNFSPSSVWVCFICSGHGRGWWLGYAGYAGVCTKLNYIFAPVKHALHAQSGSRVPDGCWPLHSGKIWCGDFVEIVLCTPWSNVHNEICIYIHVFMLFLYWLNYGF